MKKILSLILVLIIVISAVGCGGGKDGGSVGTDKVDVTISGDTAMEEAYNVFLEPAKYEGKTVSVSGTYTTDGPLNYVYISGENGNGGTTFEFTYDGAMPEDGDSITVTGKLEVKSDGNMTTLNIKADTVETVE